MSCHTHPNDRLLQLFGCIIIVYAFVSCHTHPNDRLLQLRTSVLCAYDRTVVIPILTTGFYNTQAELDQLGVTEQLSYPS